MRKMRCKIIQKFRGKAINVHQKQKKCLKKGREISKAVVSHNSLGFFAWFVDKPVERFVAQQHTKTYPFDSKLLQVLYQDIEGTSLCECSEIIPFYLARKFVTQKFLKENNNG